MFSPDLVGWRVQYALMKRSHDRLLQPYASNVVYNDDLQHFFQDCWHVKDWIKNDGAVEQSTRDRVEGEAEASQVLQIVGDLANGSKHLRRTKLDRTGAYVTQNNLTLRVDGGPINSQHIVTLSDGTELEARDLVANAVPEWRQILARLRLDE